MPKHLLGVAKQETASRFIDIDRGFALAQVANASTVQSFDNPAIL
ncbi:hypothetical protein [Teredinibacter purpureus]|nr:hypothetical protein [Teredinibacter purpureus]